MKASDSPFRSMAIRPTIIASRTREHFAIRFNNDESMVAVENGALLSCFDCAEGRLLWEKKSRGGWRSGWIDNALWSIELDKLPWTTAIRAFELPIGECIREVTLPNTCYAAAFTPDGAHCFLLHEKEFSIVSLTSANAVVCKPFSFDGARSEVLIEPSPDSNAFALWHQNNLTVLSLDGAVLFSGPHPMSEWSTSNGTKGITTPLPSIRWTGPNRLLFVGATIHELDLTRSKLRLAAGPGTARRRLNADGNKQVAINSPFLETLRVVVGNLIDKNTKELPKFITNERLSTSTAQRAATAADLAWLDNDTLVQLRDNHGVFLQVQSATTGETWAVFQLQTKIGGRSGELEVSKRGRWIAAVWSTEWTLTETKPLLHSNPARRSAPEKPIHKTSTKDRLAWSVGDEFLAIHSNSGGLRVVDARGVDLQRKHITGRYALGWDQQHQLWMLPLEESLEKTALVFERPDAQEPRAIALTECAGTIIDVQWHPTGTCFALRHAERSGATVYNLDGSVRARIERSATERCKQMVWWQQSILLLVQGEVLSFDSATGQQQSSILGDFQGLLAGPEHVLGVQAQPEYSDEWAVLLFEEVKERVAMDWLFTPDTFVRVEDALWLDGATLLLSMHDRGYARAPVRLFRFNPKQRLLQPLPLSVENLLEHGRKLHHSTGGQFVGLEKNEKVSWIPSNVFAP